MSDTNSAKKFGLLFYVIFGFVAAVAITDSLQKFSDTLNMNVNIQVTNSLKSNSTHLCSIDAQSQIDLWKKMKLDCVYLIHLSVIISFFVVAIPFYHTAAIFLSNADLILGPKRKLVTIILYSVVLLVEVSLLFFMAININVITENTQNQLSQKNIAFILSLMLMILIDSVWTILEKSATRNIRIPDRSATRNIRIPNEWSYTNFLLLLLLFWIMIYLYNAPIIVNEYLLIYFLLLVVLLARGIVNYFVGWDAVYSTGFSGTTDVVGSV